MNLVILQNCSYKKKIYSQAKLQQFRDYRVLLRTVQARDGSWSGRPAGRVTGRVEILRPAGQAG